jgi:tetratricopeptide (TPR) repeat protein
MELDATSALTEIKKYEDTLGKDPASYCFAPLAELYRKTGNLDEAITTAKQGCELHPDYVGGFMALGRAYFEKGMKAECRAALERVVGITPDNLLALKLLSHLYLEQGEAAAAGQALRSILSHSPEDHESQALLDSLVSDEVELEEEEIIEELTDEDFVEDEDLLVEEEFEVSPVETGPQGGNADVLAEKKSPISTSTLAELYVSQGFLTHALTIYREMLDSDPDNADLKKRVDELARVVAEEAGGTGTGLPEDDEDVTESAAIFGAAGHLPVDTEIVGEDRVIVTLEKWLDAIRRRR